MFYFKGSSHVSTSSNPREIVVSALEQANAISSVANSLLQPQIDEDNILKAQVSILLHGYICIIKGNVTVTCHYFAQLSKCLIL